LQCPSSGEISQSRNPTGEIKRPEATPSNDWYKEAHPYDIVQGFVGEASEEYGVDSDLINAVINAESSYRPDVKSAQNAVGYMQITPEVAKKYKVTDPLDPVQNIRAGTQYLRDLIERFDGDTERAVRAYHRGPTAEAKERPVGPKTRRYAKKVMVSKGFQDVLRANKNRPREGWKRRSLSEFRQAARDESGQ